MEDYLEPVYDHPQMDEALVSPFRSYSQLLEQGTPDVVLPLGAPNEHEENVRFLGAESDIVHNYNTGNDLSDTTLLVPNDIDLEKYAIDVLEELEVEVQETDELYTTFDDWKSAEDITSSKDTIHGHTSDYHGKKAHITGWSLVDFLDGRDVNTFGYRTQKDRREIPWKHNDLMQTLDSVRQLYYVAKDRNPL